jgi:hypothetical protein
LPGDGILFIANVKEPQSGWTVTEPSDAREFATYYKCMPPDGDPNSRIAVRTRSDSEVELVDSADPSRVLATHRIRDIAATRIQVGDLTLSPDGAWLGYTVTEHRGSFVAPVRGYVLELAAPGRHEPRLLAAPVFGPIRWSTDGRAAYACVGGDGQTSAVYRWLLHDNA